MEMGEKNGARETGGSKPDTLLESTRELGEMSR